MAEPAPAPDEHLRLYLPGRGRSRQFLAFGAFLPGVALGQWAAKVGGGALWAWLIRWWRKGRA